MGAGRKLQRYNTAFANTQKKKLVLFGIFFVKIKYLRKNLLDKQLILWN